MRPGETRIDPFLSERERPRPCELSCWYLVSGRLKQINPVVWLQ